MKLEPYLIPITNIKLKWTINLNIITETENLIEEKRGKPFFVVF